MTNSEKSLIWSTIALVVATCALAAATGVLAYFTRELWNVTAQYSEHTEKMLEVQRYQFFVTQLREEEKPILEWQFNCEPDEEKPSFSYKRLYISNIENRLPLSLDVAVEIYDIESGDLLVNKSTQISLGESPLIELDMKRANQALKKFGAGFKGFKAKIDLQLPGAFNYGYFSFEKYFNPQGKELKN